MTPTDGLYALEEGTRIVLHTLIDALANNPATAALSTTVKAAALQAADPIARSKQLPNEPPGVASAIEASVRSFFERVPDA